MTNYIDRVTQESLICRLPKFKAEVKRMFRKALRCIFGRFCEPQDQGGWRSTNQPDVFFSSRFGNTDAWRNLEHTLIRGEIQRAGSTSRSSSRMHAVDSIITTNGNTSSRILSEKGFKR